MPECFLCCQDLTLGRMNNNNVIYCAEDDCSNHTITVIRRGLGPVATLRKEPATLEDRKTLSQVSG